jgi:hypothetical protein
LSQFPHHRPEAGLLHLAGGHLWRERDGRVGGLGLNPYGLVMQDFQYPSKTIPDSSGLSPEWRSFKNQPGFKRPRSAIAPGLAFAGH